MRYKTYKRGGYSVGSISVSGGESATPVTLSRDPIGENEAATKGYVDSKAENLSVSSFSSGTMPVGRLPEFGGDLIKLEGSGETAIKSTGVVVGSYPKVTVNSKGQVTAGGALVEGDIPSLPWSKIVGGLPTTLAGYGITDALPLSGGVMTGPLKVGVVGSAPGSLVTKEYVDSLSAGGSGGVSTGGIVYKLTDVTPNGFLRANGGEISKTTYADLYAVIGDTFAFAVGNQMPGNGKPWKQQYEINTEQSTDITGWTTGTSLPGALSYSQAIVTKNRVYLLGGSNGSTYTSTVYTAPINTDGTLGAWATGANLPGGLIYSQAIVTKNRVYLLGGHNGSNAVSTVFTAPINADGTLGTWTIGTSLPGALANSQAIVTKNRVYLLGGYSNTYTSTVYTAPINADGTLGTWTTGTGLPVTLYASQAIVTKNRVYLLGGHNGGAIVAAVYTAPINEDGTLGAWTTGASLPVTLYFSQAIVTKNRVYLLGGSNGYYVNTVYTAPINEDGTLGTWTTGASLPGTLGYSQAIVTKNRVYLLGGVNSSTVYSAPFSGGLNDYSPYYDGTITPLDPSSTTFRLPDIQSKLSGAVPYIKY